MPVKAGTYPDNVTPLFGDYANPARALESEQSTLGGLMLENDAWPKVAEIVSAADFHRVEHRAIFAAIEALAHQDTPFDVVTLSEALEARGELEDAGGTPYLATLARDTPTAANITHYARLVRKYSLARQCQAAINQGNIERLFSLHEQYKQVERGEARPLLDVSDAEDVAAWFDTPPAPRRYLLDDFLPAGVEGIVSAPGGTGKGFFTLNIALSVASGLSFIPYDVSESGGVLMLQAEDDQDEMNRRIAQAVSVAREDPGIDLHDFRHRLARNLMVRSVRGLDVRLLDRGEGGRTQRTLAADRIIALAREFERKRGAPLKLILLDPLAQFFGLEENSNGDANLFISEIRRIAAETGAAVLIVHHANKEGMRRGDMSQANSRGASALTDGVRWQVNLATMSEAEAKEFDIDEDDAGQYIKAKVTKSNYSPPSGIQWYQRCAGGRLEPVRLDKVHDMEKEAKAEKLAESIKHKVACAIGRGEEYSKRAFAEKFAKELSAGRQRVEQIINDMLKTGSLREASPSKPTRNVRRVLRLPAPVDVQGDNLDVQSGRPGLTSNDVQKSTGRPSSPSLLGFGRPSGWTSKNALDARDAATAGVSGVQDVHPLKGAAGRLDVQAPHGLGAEADPWKG